MRLRRYRLDEIYDAVVRAAHLRRPQREVFDLVHKLVGALDDDLPRVSQERLVQQLQDQALVTTDTHPNLLIHLATGVGKTRLMGALIAYLKRSGQTNNVLILAPRSAVLEKLERESQAASPKYLFIDPTLQPEPRLCFRGNLESFEPSTSDLNVFVLSPQSITGKEKRAARPSEFRGFSILEYLSNLDDLVVFVDETHHLSGQDEDPSVWTQTIQDLNPRLQFGLTATPRERSGANVIYSYDLATCLREGLYTKAAEVIVEPVAEGVSEDDWDHYTIDFALKRLDRKERVLKAISGTDSSFLDLQPVALVCARDTSHAEQLAGWLKQRRGFSDEELLVTHSERTKTEEDIKRLVGIDRPGSRVRVVINVFQLTEGWDVTNVYVVAPLRAMATFQGAIQTMGRGLRLPAGRRVGDPDADTLDLICFGRETAAEILEEAMQEFGRDQMSGPALDVRDAEDVEDDPPPAVAEVTFDVVREVELILPDVSRVPAEPDLDFRISSAGSLSNTAVASIDLATLQTSGLDEEVEQDFDVVVRRAASRILSELPYLSDFVHRPQVEDLVRTLLLDLGAAEHGTVVVDPMKVAVHVSDEIHRRYRGQASQFVASGDPVIVKPGATRHLVREDATTPTAKVSLDAWG